ncbi:MULTISPECIES: putative DNA-binding protein [Paenibacillus]|uniref:putative DNA-binding protein n=1 Tax=Paenibacillus TaxID=44249 RepID=UPI0022B8C367|nr:putative DNA-binding protein [Paenibacillus caseinilyticus]MCZ8520089.1 putative DNA-binding protein [Paenibacillus caseinilyticus]
MTEDGVLLKTNRVNLLFAFYEKLLTEKQQIFMRLYFHDDYSLGEISTEFGISRQAVYEHIKRAEAVLEDYEAKLSLALKHEQRAHLMEELEALCEGLTAERKLQAGALIGRLNELD